MVWQLGVQINRKESVRVVHDHPDGLFFCFII